MDECTEGRQSQVGEAVAVAAQKPQNFQLELDFQTHQYIFIRPPHFPYTYEMSLEATRNWLKWYKIQRPPSIYHPTHTHDNNIPHPMEMEKSGGA